MHGELMVVVVVVMVWFKARDRYIFVQKRRGIAKRETGVIMSLTTPVFDDDDDDDDDDDVFLYVNVCSYDCG